MRSDTVANSKNHNKNRSLNWNTEAHKTKKNERKENKTNDEGAHLLVKCISSIDLNGSKRIEERNKSSTTLNLEEFFE